MGAIQNSLNQALASSLGMAYGISQTPGYQDFLKSKGLKRNLSKLSKARSMLETHADIVENQEAQEKVAEEIVSTSPTPGNVQQLSEVRKGRPTETPAYESLEDYYGSEDYQGEIQQEAEKRLYEEKRKRDISELVDRQKAAQESKSGVQNAVSERKAVLDELRAQGINVDNPAVRVRGVK